MCLWAHERLPQPQEPLEGPVLESHEVDYGALTLLGPWSPWLWGAKWEAQAASAYGVVGGGAGHVEDEAQGRAVAVGLALLRARAAG